MAKHLTASMRVIRAHLRQRHVSIDVARDAIKRAALIAGSDAAGPETQALVARLEKATGCSIAELATCAEEWPAE
jgi:hypothetical protein